MPRATMAELISRIRLLIADPAGAGQTFSDDEIERALDVYRTEVRYAELMPLETLTPAGAQILAYAIDRAPWEADEELTGPGWQPLSPQSADRLVGRWTFAAHQPGPVFITGKVYDLHGAAADLLEAWAAKVKLEFDFGTEASESFRRSQKVAALLSLAREYRRRQQPAVAVQVRADLSPAGW